MKNSIKRTTAIILIGLVLNAHSIFAKSITDANQNKTEQIGRTPSNNGAGCTENWLGGKQKFNLSFTLISYNTIKGSSSFFASNNEGGELRVGGAGGKVTTLKAKALPVLAWSFAQQNPLEKLKEEDHNIYFIRSDAQRQELAERLQRNYERQKNIEYNERQYKEFKEKETQVKEPKQSTGGGSMYLNSRDN